MYWHKLSRQFRTPVAILQNEVCSSEFAEYAAYDRMESTPEEQTVFLLAHLCAIVCNWGRKGKALKPQDFIPRRKNPFDKPKTDAEIKATFKAFAKAHNATWQAR